MVNAKIYIGLKMQMLAVAQHVTKKRWIKAGIIVMMILMCVKADLNVLQMIQDINAFFQRSW
jgi:hypothetical protein